VDALLLPERLREIAKIAGRPSLAGARAASQLFFSEVTAMRQRLLSLLALLLAAPVGAANLLQNPSFQTNLSGWSTPFDSMAVWDGSGRAAPGSAHATSTYVQGNAVPEAGIYQCVPVIPGRSYAFGASFFVPSNVAAEQQIAAVLIVNWYSDASCGGGFVDQTIYGLQVLRDTWFDSQRNAAAPAGSNSAYFAVSASGSFNGPTIQPIEAYIDDAYFYSDQTCADSAGNLCLGGRFRVYGDWAAPTQNKSGYMQAVPVTADSGLFWFFAPSNLEMFVKVLDACSDPYNRYWVFASGLTNVQTTLNVEDTVRGGTKTYLNSQGTAFVPVQDTSAFATCP
jgi:hypothetical protein